MSVLMLCVGRDRSLQCHRSSLKSSGASAIHFCQEHAPSGSTEIKQPGGTPSECQSSDNAVARFHHADSLTDDTDSFSGDTDDTLDPTTFLLLLAPLAHSAVRSRDRTSGKSTFLCVALSRSGLTNRKTAVGGYDVGLQRKQTGRGTQPALGYLYESDDDEMVHSNGLRYEASSDQVVEAPVGDSSLWSRAVENANNTESLPTVSGSHSVDNSLCRGPCCTNVGLEQLRGLCAACYRTLLKVNYRRRHGGSAEDIGAGLD